MTFSQFVTTQDKGEANPPSPSIVDQNRLQLPIMDYVTIAARHRRVLWKSACEDRL